MITYTKTLLEPLVAALERTQGRVAELERENGHLAERLAATEDRLRTLEAPGEAPRSGATEDAPRSRTAPDLTAEAPEPTTGVPRPTPEPGPIPPGTDGRSWWRRVWESLLSTPG
jgi:hypothetical protein